MLELLLLVSFIALGFIWLYDSITILRK